jgi:hypothetical protein
MEDNQGNHIELVEAYIASDHALIRHDNGHTEVVKLADVRPGRR